MWAEMWAGLRGTKEARSAQWERAQTGRVEESGVPEMLSLPTPKKEGIANVIVTKWLPYWLVVRTDTVQ